MGLVSCVTVSYWFNLFEYNSSLAISSSTNLDLYCFSFDGIPYGTDQMFVYPGLQRFVLVLVRDALKGKEYLVPSSADF